MKKIEARHDNALQVMYGLLLPAVGGTIFWYLIQHLRSGRLLHTLTSSVLVYYFVLHFLAGQQLEPKQYGRSGFGLDLAAVVALEVLFHAIDGLPENLEIGMGAILAILLVLFLWNVKMSRVRGSHAVGNSIVLGLAVVLVGVLWSLSYVLHELDEHRATLGSVICLAVAATAYWLIGRDPEPEPG